jgi:hypothetical protein
MPPAPATKHEHDRHAFSADGTTKKAGFRRLLSKPLINK